MFCWRDASLSIFSFFFFFIFVNFLFSNLFETFLLPPPFQVSFFFFDVFCFFLSLLLLSIFLFFFLNLVHFFSQFIAFIDFTWVSMKTLQLFIEETKNCTFSDYRRFKKKSSSFSFMKTNHYTLFLFVALIVVNIFLLKPEFFLFFFFLFLPGCCNF